MTQRYILHQVKYMFHKLISKNKNAFRLTMSITHIHKNINHSKFKIVTSHNRNQLGSFEDDKISTISTLMC
jgi:hypothetical protein